MAHGAGIDNATGVAALVVVVEGRQFELKFKLRCYPAELWPLSPLLAKLVHCATLAGNHCLKMKASAQRRETRGRGRNAISDVLSTYRQRRRGRHWMGAQVA